VRDILSARKEGPLRQSHRPGTDTSPEAERVVLALLREMSSARKAALVDDAVRTSRRLAMAGLRSRHPGDLPARLERRLAGLVLGEDLAIRVYGPLEHP
jgi:hypothetical protein